MKRALTVLTTAALVAGCVAVPDAGADPALGSAYAAAANITPGSGLNTAVTTSGDLAGLLDFLTPVLTQVVNPLTAGINGLSDTLVSDLATGLTGDGLSAASSTTPQAPPASGYPDCTSTGWSADTCYGPLVPTVAAPPVVAVSSGTVQGYATADSTGSYGRSRVADPLLTVLGIPLGDLGVAQASSTCATGSACTAVPTLTSLSLLGGTVAAKTAGDGSLLVSLGGSAFAAPSTYSTTALTAAGVTATAKGQGGTLVVSIGLTVDQLLTGLGIANTLASLNATVASSAITLNLTLGTGLSAGSDGAKAWGLEVGLGLSATLSLSVLGLVSVDLSAGDSTSNLVDLKLGYAAAAAATVDNSGQAPDLT